jgi:hypothetical protein
MIFPDKWKLVRVTPIFKSGSRSIISNYRPISILNNFAKVFERILCFRLRNHITSFMSDAQHGFLRGRSTVTNLLEFTDRVINVLDSGGRVDAVYTDFSKAFDTVSHTVLLEKLPIFGFSTNSCKFMESYLFNRWQYVSLCNIKSQNYEAKSGVPQGSNLGPLLFLILINDLPNCFKFSNCLMFADDVKIFKAITSPLDCQLLQHDLNNLSIWCQNNKLNLNIKKCIFMVYTKQKNHFKFKYAIDGFDLNQQDVVKDLGIMFDSKLTFQNHIDYLISKSSSLLGFIYRSCMDFTNVDLIKSLYIAFIRSRLEYGSVVWNPFSSEANLKLEKMQNKILRYLYFKEFMTPCPFDFPTDRLRVMFDIESLSNRRKLFDLLTLYSILNSRLYSPYLLERICFYVPVRHRRSGLLFFVPRANTLLKFYSPINRMTRSFNDKCDILDIFSDRLIDFKAKCINMLSNS